MHSSDAARLVVQAVRAGSRSSEPKKEFLFTDALLET
jgi:hypothetical protein